MPLPEPEPLSRETARLLYRLTGILAVVAGLLFIAAFLAGVVREGISRWVLLALGVLFMVSPVVLRRLLPPR
jgi:hypothetical protein